MPHKRNYRKEYDNYHKSPKQRRRRAQRNTARSTMVKAGKARKGDGKDVDHKNHDTSNNNLSNLTMMSKSRNRAKNLGRGGRKKAGKK